MKTIRNVKTLLNKDGSKTKVADADADVFALDDAKPAPVVDPASIDVLNAAEGETVKKDNGPDLGPDVEQNGV